MGKLRVKSKENENLSSLYREIDYKFPDLEEYVDSFTIIEGKKDFSAAGDPVVKEIEMTWNIENPDPEILKLIEQVVDIIKQSGQGDLEITYDT